MRGVVRNLPLLAILIVFGWAVTVLALEAPIPLVALLGIACAFFAPYVLALVALSGGATAGLWPFAVPAAASCLLATALVIRRLAALERPSFRFSTRLAWLPLLSAGYLAIRAATYDAKFGFYFLGCLAVVLTGYLWNRTMPLALPTFLGLLAWIYLLINVLLLFDVVWQLLLPEAYVQGRFAGVARSAGIGPAFLLMMMPWAARVFKRESAGLWRNVGLWAYIAGSLVVVQVAQSNTAFIVAPIAILFTVVIEYGRPSRQGSATSAVLVVLGFLAVALVLFSVGAVELGRAGDLDGRQEIWTVYWQEFRSSPILGTGAYILQSFEQSVHNAALNVLVVGGLVGGLLWATNLSASIYLSVRYGMYEAGAALVILALLGLTQSSALVMVGWAISGYVVAQRGARARAARLGEKASTIQQRPAPA